jgi:Uma2 family endonuclease
MPTLLAEQSRPESRAPRAVAWTRADCQRMDEIGLLPERWELVRGEVIDKMGQKMPHGLCVGEVYSWLRGVFGRDRVLSQITIDVSPADNPTSEPEPDVLVLNQPSSAITENPRPSQITLVVEVADTTLAFDLRAKASLYAAAGIPEYWVVDVRGRQLHLLRDPRQGAYESVRVLQETELASAPGHDATASVASLLG